MKKYIILSVFSLIISSTDVFAENNNSGEISMNIQSDNSQILPFQGELYNEEYDVFIRLDLYNSNIIVPGQEIFGEMAGYIKYTRDGRCWLITSAEINEKRGIATLEITNDYGSEDLVALLIYDKNKNTFTLQQKEGSTIKFAKNRKWVKLPSSTEFKRRK